MLDMRDRGETDFFLMPPSREVTRFVAAALIVFPNLISACRGCDLVASAPTDRVELITRLGLEHAKAMPGMPVDVDLLGAQATGVLIETSGATRDELEARIGDIASRFWPVPTLTGIRFSHDPDECTRFQAISAKVETTPEWLVV